jgi:type IV secretory pathway TraG/TraD family ATPase VirD4
VGIAWTIVGGLASDYLKALPDAVNEVLAVAAFVGGSALVAIFRPFFQKQSSFYMRGTVLRGFAPTPRAGKTHALTLAGHEIPCIDETKHFKLIGTTGTGKSTAIREILAGAFNRGDRAVIADPDASYLKRFYNPGRGDVILNPFFEGANRWDLFAEIVLPQDADQIARSLIPDHEGSDRNWRAYARTFVTAILRQLHRAKEHDLAKLYYLLIMAPLAELRELLELTPAGPFLGQDNGKFFDSVRSITNAYVDALEHVAAQTFGDLLSVRKWIRDGRGVLFLPYQAGEVAALRNIVSTWMRLAIFEAMRGPESDQRLWFIVDELDALGCIDGLKDALARLRKFGGRCVLGFQSIAQVRGTYGDAEAQTIVENCGNTLILRCSASERGGTAEFASRLIGQREIIRRHVSYSSGGLFSRHSTNTTSDEYITEDAVMSSEIEQLPDLTGFLKLASRPEWRRVVLPP